MREPTAALAPVGRDTVQDRVYQELRRALVGGLFAPGQVLTIRQLADALATSTMPVRDAVGRLITEQALEILPNRSIRAGAIASSTAPARFGSLRSGSGSSAGMASAPDR